MAAHLSVSSLSAELDHITRDYDYGIVPGSATVFVLDEQEGVGRLDMTLLEGVMVVIEVSNGGYMVTSCSPLYSGIQATKAADNILQHLNRPFDSMENLLMTISPMFCERFQNALYEKLQSVHSPEPVDLDSQAILSDTLNANITHPSESEQTAAGTDNDIHQWIH